jgi:hypothetical protein
MTIAMACAINACHNGRRFPFAHRVVREAMALME